MSTEATTQQEQEQDSRQYLLDLATERALMERIDEAFDNLIAAVQVRWPGTHFLEYIPGRLIQDFPKPRKSDSSTGRIVSKTLRTAVFERDAYRCRMCNNHIDLQADHIIPFSKGGPTQIDNLQTLCGSCNLRKGNR